MSHCVVEAGVADVSDTHSMVPRALCQSLWPCVLAGCSARETLEVRGVEGKARGRSQGYELQWPSGKFSPASKWELAQRWFFHSRCESHELSRTTCRYLTVCPRWSPTNTAERATCSALGSVSPCTQQQCSSRLRANIAPSASGVPPGHRSDCCSCCHHSLDPCSCRSPSRRLPVSATLLPADLQGHQAARVYK